MQAMARWLGGAKKVAPLLALLAATLAAVAALGVVASAASAATFSNNSGITINDGSELCEGGAAATNPGTATTYPSAIKVGGLTGSVTDVNVTVSGLSHAFPDDVGLLLVSPAGQSVILMADSGSLADAVGVNLTFDDSASGPVPDNPDTAVVSGTYLPSQGTPFFTEEECAVPASFPLGAPAGPYGTSLSVFNGTAPNGDWQLYVIDDTSLDTGSITGGWSLDISTTTPGVLTGGDDIYGEQFCPPNGDEEVFARAGDDRLRLDPCGDTNTPESPEDGFPETPDTDSDADQANGQAGNDFIRVDDGDISDTARGGAGTDQCRGDLDLGASAASVDEPPIGPGGGEGAEEDIGDTLRCEQKTWIKGFTFYTQS